ncbi:hypothetical protein H0H93_006386 [Arthromyces matolae]|nr:hypothetical protein H0H93_006386 [Arthromyces matolae]
MDHATQERQDQEITALQAILEDNFSFTPPPKAWKTYPTLACPIFSIQNPVGLSNDDVTTLTHKITAEAQKNRGSEMVFDTVTYCEDWMRDNVKMKTEAPGSLAVQMMQRAEEEEKHRPEDRPSAVELSQSPLLPTRIEDEYFKGALSLMTKADSPHHRAVLNSLFSQPPRPSRGFIYDLEADLPEHSALNENVHNRLATIFRLHGAVDMEPPLLMPSMGIEDQTDKPAFLDKSGDIVTLSSNLLDPFARLAARGSISRIKRFHISNIYETNPVAGHPKVEKAAVFDIITYDLEYGPVAASAELIAVVNDCLFSFPNLAQNYDIHISHSNIIELILTRLPSGQRHAVTDILTQSKSNVAQKRALLLKRGLLRSTADELELLSETGMFMHDDVDNLMSRVERLSPALVGLMEPYVQEVKKTIEFARATKVSRSIFFRPLMLSSHNAYFKNGVLVEVVRKNRHSDVLASGGRYDHMINLHGPLKPQVPKVCAIGLQIAVEKITVALASFQIHVDVMSTSYHISQDTFRTV